MCGLGRCAEMNDSAAAKRQANSFDRKYLWPTPVGFIFWISGILVEKLLGERAFLTTHGYFEIAIMISLIASVVYSIRLGGKGRSLAPRWVFYLNALYFPILVAVGIVSWGVISLLGQ